MKLSPMKLTHPPMRRDEVKVWQRFLQSKGIYSGSINDSFDEATAAATAKYAERNYLRGDDVFVISFDRPDRDHFAKKDGSVDLRPSFHDVLSKIAYGYYLLTGSEIVVTDGYRLPGDQAAQMHKKAKDGRRALDIYKDQSLVEPIWVGYDKAHKAGAGEQGEIEAMAAVIQEQVNHGHYVSKHLTGVAFDVRKMSSGSDQRAFVTAAEEVLSRSGGQLITNERGGDPHFHVQLDR